MEEQEEVSWVYHPVLGVYTRWGYGTHYGLLYDHPELLEVAGPGHPAGQVFDPARGYTRIDRTQRRLVYTKYDQVVRPIAADAVAIDLAIRIEFKIPKSFKSELHGERRYWANWQNFKFVPHKVTG